MLEQLENSLSDRIRLFLQANHTDDRQSISIIDIIELIDFARNQLIDELVPEEIILKNTPKMIGGHIKYKNDEKQNFQRFWDDVEGNIEEVFRSAFLREITLGTKTKMSTPLMVKRFVPIIIHPLIKIFQNFGPVNTINVIGTNDDPFDWLLYKFIHVEYNTSEIDILVAQKVISKYARGQ